MAHRMRMFIFCLLSVMTIMGLVGSSALTPASCSLAAAFLRSSAVMISYAGDSFARQIPEKPTARENVSGESNTITYDIEERGSLFTPDFRVFFKGPDGYISPWHDIPLFSYERQLIYNLVVEIPRWTNAKIEMATREPLSPLRQDVSGGALRFVANLFPHHGYIWNYGALPQTWENDEHVDEVTGARGDNDPIDVVEIGSAVHRRGAVVQVKVVGCLALLDEGETDWKLVAIDIRDPVAASVNDMADVERVFPGLAKATYEWFRDYKLPAGKPANAIGFGGRFLEAPFCHKVIWETHNFWRQLIAEPAPKLQTMARVNASAHRLTSEGAAAIVERAPVASVPSPNSATINKWHFLSTIMNK